MDNENEELARESANASDAAPARPGEPLPPSAGGAARASHPAPQAPRRSPSTAARRKQAKDTEAQIEQWRARQATRAVRHPEYDQGAARPQQLAGRGTRASRSAAGNAAPAPSASRPAQPARPASGERAQAPQGRPAPQPRNRPPRPQPKRTQPFPVSRDGGPAGGGFPVPDDAATRARSFFTEDVPRWAKGAGSKAVAAAGAMDPALRSKVIAIAVVALLYFIVMVHFSIHFYPNSNIGSIDVSGMSVGEAAEVVEAAAGDYELKVEGDNGVSFTVMSHEAGLSLDAEGLVRQAMTDPGILWPIELLLPHDHSDVLVASADAGGFRSKVSDAVNWYNQDATAPQDATIQYDEGAHSFKIVEEVRGDTLDEEKIVEHVTQALAVMQPLLTLGEDDYEQPEIRSDDPRLQEALEQAQVVLSTNTTFKAHDSEVATLNGDTAAKWVITDEDVTVALDENQVNNWVQELVDKSSTVGAKRTWTREDGVECTVEGGDYGWEADWLAVDAEVHDAVLNGKTEEVEVPMVEEAAVYNGAHGRDWKAYIDVDLDAQMATYYGDKGEVKWSAYFVSGSPDGEHDTPQGVYYVKAKESPSLLVGERNATGSPEYQTKVQYWIPWRGNDVGFHDADWQDAFGGTRYLDGYGSHGCINLAPGDVASLYQLVSVGTVVVSHGTGTHKIENTLSSSSSSSASESSSSSAAEGEAGLEEESEPASYAYPEGEGAAGALAAEYAYDDDGADDGDALGGIYGDAGQDDEW